MDDIFKPMDTTPPPLPAAKRDGPAWEWWRQLGFFRALWLTTREILFQPSATFRLFRREGGFANPLLFYLTMSVGVSLINFFIGLPFVHEREAVIADMLRSQPNAGAYLHLYRFFSGPTGMMLGLLNHFTFLPLGLVLGIILGSGVMHLLLMLFGAARYPYETTFRIFAYVGGACAIFNLIPFGVGVLLHLILWPIILIMGLVEIHETETWRVVLALVLPGLVLIMIFSSIFLFIIIHIMKGVHGL